MLPFRNMEEVAEEITRPPRQRVYICSSRMLRKGHEKNQTKTKPKQNLTEAKSCKKYWIEKVHG